MKIINAFGLAVVVSLTCTAQQREKRRFGPPTVWGPVRTLLVEQAQIIDPNGELSEGPRILLQTIEYNEDGTRKEVNWYAPEGTISRKTIEIYDPDGRLLEARHFSGDGTSQGRMVSLYDSSKRLTEQTIYRSNGSIANKITFAYQNNQRIHESVSYDQNGAVLGRVTGTLDLKTHVMEAVRQTPNQIEKRQSSFTDIPEGQVFQEKVNDNLTQRSLSRPLGPGRVEWIEYNPDGTVKSQQRFESQLDSHGNLVKRVRFIKDKSGDFHPVEVLYWTIEYYGKS